MKRSVPVIAFLALLAACDPPTPSETHAPDLVMERVAVDSVLSDLHQMASDGNFEQYFKLFAPDAVFFGTDATERWSVDEFRGYAAGASGWTYDKTERHVFVDDDGNTAWFDERLENANYGETRGTGVLVKGGEGWKIIQYNLTIPVPNDLAREFAARIRELAGEK